MRHALHRIPQMALAGPPWPARRPRRAGRTAARALCWTTCSRRRPGCSRSSAQAPRSSTLKSSKSLVRAVGRARQQTLNGQLRPAAACGVGARHVAAFTRLLCLVDTPTELAVPTPPLPSPLRPALRSGAQPAHFAGSGRPPTHPVGGTIALAFQPCMGACVVPLSFLLADPSLPTRSCYHVSGH